ncbi:sialidase family protein [Eubacteriales bacterium mix99]|jgi:sialidase-1
MQELYKTSLTRYNEGPYPYYRIPGMVVTAKGTILTYFETRMGGSDWQTRGVGYRRSEDGGQTWSSIDMLAERTTNTAVNNPVMIAARDGRIYFLWQEDYHRGFLQYSDDDGISFHSLVEITEYLEQFYTKYGYRWDVFAFGPGHGIELKSGTLLVPVWMANGGKRVHHPSVVSTIVSHDSGKTWEVGEIIGPRDLSGNNSKVVLKKDKDSDCERFHDEVPSPDSLRNPNETSAVQLDDGSVLLNIRHEGKTHYRAISVSPNGLTDFSEPIYDRQLPDPICCGSITRSGKPVSGQCHAIAFSNCAVRPCRENNYSRVRARLTLRLSLDNCQTWNFSRLLEERAGYSDIAFSNDGKWLYCFYEHDVDGELYTQPRYLTFARVNLEWLTDGETNSEIMTRDKKQV